MSKIEADKFELSFTEFEFSKMLHQVIDVLEFRLTEKKQTLTLDMENNIPRYIISDEQRLAQVITNLLANAIKFTPEKGSITIGVRKLPDNDAREISIDSVLSTGALCTLEIRVSDTGIGISEEQQAKLFQSFQQVDNTIARKFGGTGLGLAISKKVVEMLNGKIRVESEPGKGSSFIFTMETEQIPDIPAENKAAVENPDPIEEEDNFTGRRILLAEDVDINREIVITILEPTGLVIDEAENGQIAFDKFNADPSAYNLIFMDIHMPGMDGYETTRKIRALEIPEAKNIPIIAMTANVFKEDVERCMAAGMNGHIGKPLDFDEVMTVLRKYLSPIT
jgi:CheY-like chemotaxis protein